MEGLFSDADIPRQPSEIYPGCVHLPGWLTMEQQNFLVKQFNEWGSGRQINGKRVGIPPHSPEVFGHPMSVRLTTLGWHWKDNRYLEQAPEFEGASPLPVPDWLQRLGTQALAAAYQPAHSPSWPATAGERQELLRSYLPDMALVNYYSPQARMGMHQDKDEKSSMPIVSVSIGDTGLFRAGNTDTKNKPYQDLLLASGDMLVFGGPSRFMFHGVPKILAGTAPQNLNFSGGRINITLRQTGLPRPLSSTSER